MNKFFGVTALVGLCYFWLFESNAQAAPAGPRQLVASWYNKSARRDGLTKSGEKFDPNKLTCASWQYYKKRLRVTGPLGSVEVLCNDVGPNKRLLKTRQIDLSRAAFAKICPLDAGLVEVEVIVIP